MQVKIPLWVAGAVGLVGLGAIALTRQERGGSLEAAEASTGRLARSHGDDSAAARRRLRDLRAELTERVRFGSDQWAIQPADTAILDAKVSILKADPSARIRIIGHADERGAEIYNLALGRRRAVAAKAYLVEHGVEASRIETVSAGVGQPIDLRHSEAAWAKNRRDEFQIIDDSEPLGPRP
jgi:peptidoglycan-associated lipoprotein